MSHKIPREIKLVVWRVFERLWGGLGGVWGGQRGVKGGSKGGQGGSAPPLYGPIYPSGNLVGDQIGFQTPYSSTNGQIFTG